MMTSHSDAGALASGGRRDAARMESIASASDQPTVDLLQTLELPPTAVAIDVGCGTGSLARAIAHDVIPDGFVLALDQDISVAQDSGAQPNNVALVESDVRTFAPDGPIDLVHARFVLAHLHDRNDVLETVSSWLAPGGRIIITEPAALSIGPNAPEPVRTVFSAYHRWVREEGMSFDFATEAAGILSQLGARDVTVHTRTSRFGGGPAADRWLPLITPIADHLINDGVDGAVLSDFAAFAADRQTFVIPQIIMTTCARWI